MANPPRQQTPQRDNPALLPPAPPPEPRGAHAPRLWLLALLVLVAAGTASALFARHQLDSVRGIIEREARTRTGAPLSFDALTTNGLRGLRIENFALDLPAGDGPRMRLEIPLAKIDIDFVEMLAGRIEIERIHADNATIVVERPPEGAWFAAGPRPGRIMIPGLANAAFRITGENCILEVRNIIGDTSITLTGLQFDVSRQLDSASIQAHLSAQLDGNAEQRLDLTALYAGPDAFIVQGKATGIDAEEVNVFLPASQHFVLSGVASPQVRVDASPGNPIVMHLHTPLENLTLRDQPDFLDPVNGDLTVLAQYNPETAALTITAAEADTDQLSGSLRGSVDFAGEYPALDLHLTAPEVPLQPFAEALLPGDLEDYGEITLDLAEAPASIEVRLSGTTDAPVFEATMRLAGGRLVFAARDPNHPSGSVVLGASEVVWNPEAAVPSGTLRVVDGTINSRLARIQAERVAATVTLDGGLARVDPLTFETGGNRFVGSALYPVEGGPVEVALRGAVPGLEETVFHDLVENLSLGGTIAIDGTGTFEPGRIRFAATLEATQGAVGYDWWFFKPPGIALQAGFDGEFRLTRGEGEFTIRGDVASSQVDAAFRFARNGDSWDLMAIDADISHLDVPTVGKCLVFPYRIAGTHGSAGTFTWRRTGPAEGQNHATLAAMIDELTLLPEGGTEPIFLQGARVHLDLTNEPRPINTLTVDAARGAMPSFGDLWFAPIDREDPRWAAMPEPEGPDRDWHFHVRAEELSVPPWHGFDFSAEIRQAPTQVALPRFAARIGDDGRLDGAYHEDTIENFYRLELDWNRVPIEMFLEHLELPPVLDGLIDGTLAYEMDRDDPSTRTGSGRFTVRDGRLGATFVESLLGADGGAAPPIWFTELRSEVGFEADIVRTPTVALESPQLRAEGTGQFVFDGDMDYEVRLSVTPETAAQIPAMRDAFNIEGLRLAQQNIDLTFAVSGPLFNPQGSVSGLPPVSVTLVSGALGITSGVLDTPRKILVDLLKLGGGILGTTR